MHVQDGWSHVFLTLCPPAGELVWRRHGSPGVPSHRALRATCMALLPLVEMYCKWELEEDCSDLTALMHRFDSEAVLATHELGRSLLLMLRDEETGLEILPPPLHLAAAVNPFDAIRGRLQALDTAFQALRPQVHPAVVCSRQFSKFWVAFVLMLSVFYAATILFVQKEFNEKKYCRIPSPVHGHYNSAPSSLLCMGSWIVCVFHAKHVPISSVLVPPAVVFPVSCA